MAMSDQPRHHHGHDDHGHDHRVHFDTPAAAEFAELEGEALLPIVETGVGHLAAECDRRGLAVRTIVDLGCGPGVGTGVLAGRFADAVLVATDGSDEMLARAAARAERLGFSTRMRMRRLALPDEIEQLDRADVIWASMVLHHVGDEVAALRRLRPALERGGVLALVERAQPTRVVLSGVNAGGPELWSRLDTAWESWFADMRAELPGSTSSDDYRTMLDAAGYQVIADEVLPLERAAPLDDRVARFAHEHLARSRRQLVAYAEADDLGALDELIGAQQGHGFVQQHGSLHVARRLFVAIADPAA